MQAHRKLLITFLIGAVLFELIAAWLVGLDRPAWEDEAHFYQTVKLFGSDLSLSTLKTYPEMSTPLPFVAYALWGDLFGFQLSHLRILSIVLGILTNLIFLKLLLLLLRDIRLVVFGAVLLIIQPYMVGFSMFVYTDISAILFGIIALYGIIKRSWWICAFGLALAVLCRQYMAFLTVAAFLFFFLEWILKRKNDSMKLTVAAIASALPYLGLVILWGGTSPDNPLRKQFLDEGVRFHPEMLSLYIAGLFVYAFPALAVNYRTFYKNWFLAALSVIGVGFIVLFPVHVSKPLAILGVSRVGQFHRLLKDILGNEFLVHMGFAICFLLALPLIFYLLKDSYDRIRQETFDARLLIALSIIVFLAMMPFSYLGWEKYLMPVIPGVIAYLCMIYESRNGSPVSGISRQEPS